MDNKKITFNINGCCVLRDIFGIREDEGIFNYEVLRFRQFSSPITWFLLDDKPSEKISIEYLQNLQVDGMLKNNFSKKCVVDDYNKSVLDSYDRKSDFFLLDFAEARYGIVNLTFDNGRKHQFTATGRILQKNREGVRFLDLLEGQKEIVSFKEYDTPYNIKRTCELLVDWLINKMGYKESEIILVETQSALEYTNGENIYQFPNINNIISENDYIKKWNDEFKQIMPNCKTIKFPDTYIADTRNKWKKHPLHFCREVYDYLYEAINVIVKKGASNEIEYYRNRCTKLIEEKISYYNHNKIYEEMLISHEHNSKAIDVALRGLNEVCNCKLLNVNEYIQDLNSSINRELNRPILKCVYHVSKEGWIQKFGSKIICNGNKNTNLNLEAIKLNVLSSNDMHINYSVRLKERLNFTNVYSDGVMSGTTGRNIPIIGIKIWLSGCGAQDYDICYQISGSNEYKSGKNGEEISLENEAITKISLEIF